MGKSKEHLWREAGSYIDEVFTKSRISASQLKTVFQDSSLSRIAIMKYSLALLALPFLCAAANIPRAATVTTLPAYTGTLTLTTATRIPAGGSYDGKMKRIDTGHPCELDVELGDADIVFILGEGTTLSNVIIGPAQKRGVHCLGKCTLNNVWWSKTCYYGLSIVNQKAGDKTTISGGGAFGVKAADNGMWSDLNVMTRADSVECSHREQRRWYR